MIQFQCFAEASLTRSKITSAIPGSVPTAAEYQTSFPCRSIGFLQTGCPAARRSPMFFFCFAEQQRNVLLGMQPIADEKRDDHQVFGPRQGITIGDARRFFQKNRVDVRIDALRTNQFHLPLDRLAGVFILLRPVSGDKQRRLGIFRRARKGKGLQDPRRTGQNDRRHAIVRPDGRAIDDFGTVRFSQEISIFKTQLMRDDLAGKIAFADT